MTEIVRPRAVCQILGVSRSTLERWRRSGHFPVPVKLGPVAVGWRRGDVEAWLADRPIAA